MENPQLTMSSGEEEKPETNQTPSSERIRMLNVEPQQKPNESKS